MTFQEIVIKFFLISILCIVILTFNRVNKKDGYNHYRLALMTWSKYPFATLLQILSILAIVASHAHYFLPEWMALSNDQVLLPAMTALFTGNLLRTVEEKIKPE